MRDLTASQVVTIDSSRNGFVSQSRAFRCSRFDFRGLARRAPTIDRSRNGFVSLARGTSCGWFCVVSSVARRIITIDRSRNGFVSRFSANGYARIGVTAGLARRIIRIDRSRNGFVSQLSATACARFGVVAGYVRQIVTSDRSRNGFVSPLRAIRCVRFQVVAGLARQIGTSDRSRNGFVSRCRGFFDGEGLLEFRDAAFKFGECHQFPAVVKDELERLQADGFGRSRRGDPNDLGRRPDDASAHVANGLVERGLAAVPSARPAHWNRSRAFGCPRGKDGGFGKCADRRTANDRGDEPEPLHFVRVFRRRHRLTAAGRQAHRASVSPHTRFSAWGPGRPACP